MTKRIISIILALLLGDADCDNEVTILDATAIQRDLASIAKLNDTGARLADTDSDGEVTIIDATYIQRRLAALSCPEGIGNPIETEPDVGA